MADCNQFPHKHGGTHIETYNRIIRRIADLSGCELVDLYDYGMPYDAIDGSHPNKQGMMTIATEVIRSIAGDGILKYMDCSYNDHRNTSVHDNLVGSTIGDKYKVLSLTAMGGFFKTYLAFYDKYNKVYAMKVCDKKQGGYSLECRDVILQEAHMMMKLNHPAIQ